MPEIEEHLINKAILHLPKLDEKQCGAFGIQGDRKVLQLRFVVGQQDRRGRADIRLQNKRQLPKHRSYKAACKPRYRQTVKIRRTDLKAKIKGQRLLGSVDR